MGKRISTPANTSLSGEEISYIMASAEYSEDGISYIRFFAVPYFEKENLVNDANYLNCTTNIKMLYQVEKINYEKNPETYNDKAYERFDIYCERYAQGASVTSPSYA